MKPTGSASVYIRLSREAGASNLSLQGMTDEAHALAERAGYGVVATHVDDGTSGAVRNRPHFLAWLDDARSGRVDALVTFHADRLTREGVNVAAMVLDVIEGKDATTGQVVRAPVRLLAVDGLDSRDADSFRWRFVIAAEVARSERERIKARNIATKKRLLKAGRFPGGNVPFGCKVVERDGGKYLERDDDEAGVLVAAAKRLLRNDSIRSVCIWLSSEGHTTRKGAFWQRTSLRSTMLSTHARDHVFDRATYKALEIRLKPKKSGVSAPRGGRPNKWLLAGGLGKCGTCGQSLTTAGGGKSGAAVRYTCVGASKGQCKARAADGSGGSATINARALDERIEREFLAHYGETYGLELRVTVSGPEGLDEAERAYDGAQEALRDDLSEENFRAAQEARARFEGLRSQPVVRSREIHLTDKTIGEMWAEAESDIPDRSRMLSQALAEPVILHPGKPLNTPTGRGKIPNVDRAVIIWRDEVEIEPAGSQTQVQPPW